MKRTNTRLVSLLLSGAMLLSLAACSKGSGKNEDPNLMELGDYTLLYKSSCIMTDFEGVDALVMTLDFTNNSEESASYVWSVSETAIQNEESLDLATIYTNPETYDEVISNQFVDVAPGETLEVQTAFRLLDTTNPVEVTFEEFWGSKNGKITVDPSTLSRETPANGMALPDMTEGTSDIGDPPNPLSWWNGPWYGWWVMTDCTGYYEGMDGEWWDVCGVIDIGDDSMGTVTLWDEDYTQDEPMAEAAVSLNQEGTGEYGTLMSEGGWFTNIALEHADWIVDPGLVDYPDMIHINGYYEDGGDEYTYDIYLRPWGVYWDDVLEEDLPGTYYDWYLPMIQAGKEMPGVIGADAPVSSGSAGTPAPGQSGTAPGNVPGGDGIVTQEQVEKGYVYMSEVAKDIYNTTYEELAAYFGVEGQFVKEEYSDHMQENRRYYKWISSENANHFIYVNFAEREPGRFVVCAFNTSGFSGSEAKEKYLDIVKAEAAEVDKAAAANMPMKDFTLEVTQFAKDDVKVTITTTIPESGWSSTKDSLVENEDPTAFGAGEIVFTVRDSVEKFDNNKSSFKNYQDIEDRVIGGITFKGRTYEYIGYSWIEYVAQIDEGRALSIGLAKMDCFPGTAPDIILNNMQFK